MKAIQLTLPGLEPYVEMKLDFLEELKAVEAVSEPIKSMRKNRRVTDPREGGEEGTPKIESTTL